jgi:mRNA-degrading endonuclease toxin of MazEF toxin-antitoxin module
MNNNEPLVKNFDKWNELAKVLNNLETPLYNKKLKKYFFHPREIWFCSVGVNIGVEICGKNKDFERPILIIKKSGRRFVCLPLTSQKPNNPDFYFDISYTDPNTKKLVESYIFTTNFITLDVNRLQRRIRKLNTYEFNDILKKAKDYLDEF